MRDRLARWLDTIPSVDVLMVILRTVSRVCCEMNDDPISGRVDGDPASDI